MGTGIFFPICALPIIIIIILTFNLKEHLESEETKLFNMLCISNFIGLIIEILCSYACRIFDTQYFLSSFILKSYLAYLIIWTAMFATYIIMISKKQVLKTYRFMHIIVLLFLVVIIFILPIEVVTLNNFQIHYTKGLSVNFAYFVSFIYVLVILLVMLKNLKYLKNKKYLPVFLFFVIGTISIAIQHTYPQFLLLTYAETLICLCMYFTIENPDVQMIRELYKNKKIIEKSNEDTSKFMFRITQDIKNPIKEIISISNDMKTMTKKDELLEANKYVINQANQLDYLINKALNISSMDTGKIKIYENKYNVQNLFKEISYRASEETSNNIKFKYTIGSSIPTYLYGDAIKLKQAITSILRISKNFTKEGFINLDVSSIIKYNICRLIITIEDSGRGISIDRVNEILSMTGDKLSNINIDKIEEHDLDIIAVKKIINLIGGSLMIKSEEGKGTTVTITLDQKIVETPETELTKRLESYEQTLYGNKKILIIDDDEEELAKITSYLEKEEIDVTASMFGRDAIEKIRVKAKYDLIILDDELNDINALNVLQELQKFKNFKTPVVVMINDNKEGIKLHYLKDGFADTISKSKLETELARVIKRFWFFVK